MCEFSLEKYKAVFLDYTGTMVLDNDKYIRQLIKLFMANSDLKDPGTVLTVCWAMIKESEQKDYLDTFIDTDVLVDRILAICAEKYHLTGDLEAMHDIWRCCWIHSPLYPDAEEFFNKCTLPIYVVSNDNLAYLQQSMEEKGLHPAGIISAEMVRACKPHVEILQEALREANVLPEEAVMIGDSEKSDVACAEAAGVQPVLLDRNGKSTRTDIPVIHLLTDIL